jgi:uncharacterized protein
MIILSIIAGVISNAKFRRWVLADQSIVVIVVILSRDFDQLTLYAISSTINYSIVMETGKLNFFLKLHPPRPTFMQDMTEAERGIMQLHIAFWAPYVQDGTVIVLGPVMDPNGGYGIAVVSVDSAEQLHEIVARDPANGLNRYEIWPMRAVTKA